MTDYTEELNSVAESFRQCPASFLYGVLGIVEAELVLRGFPEDTVAVPVKAEMNSTRPRLTIVKGDKE